MKILFVNPREPACGVHEYGVRLADTLSGSEKHTLFYSRPDSQHDHFGEIAVIKPDVIIYNWIDGIGGWLSGAPFKHGIPSVTIYHDGFVDPDRWQAILFSDPTMSARGKWHAIGRPLAQWAGLQQPTRPINPWIGVAGFMGAWCTIALPHILREFDHATIRLHLPFSAHCDRDGVRARSAAAICRGLCRDKGGIELEINHDFMPPDLFLGWLAANDLNVFMRDLPDTWCGVSSVLDCAIAVARPIAVNANSAFRHVQNLTPSICVEHNSLKTIMANGTRPLWPLLEAWSPAALRAQVEPVLEGIYLAHKGASV